MRLFLVPIIHSSSDMGSLAPRLSEKSAAAIGKRLWRDHQATVSAFWKSIAQFFGVLDVKGYKVYQDGLVAGGDEGLKIVEECARRGSTNYIVVSNLLRGGALLVKTEDVSLIKKEYGYITNLTRARTAAETEAATRDYRLARQGLIEERDSYIAKTVHDTLKGTESGVLFIGAYHDIMSRLNADIRVVQVKEVAKVREYHRLLTGPRTGKNDRRLRQLSTYLAEPVSDGLVD